MTALDRSIPAGLGPELAAEFERWCKQLDAEVMECQYSVTAADVLRAHFTLAAHFGSSGDGFGGVGPRSLQLLQSAVSRQFVSLGRARKWTTLYELSATLFYGLIRDHAFHDANKRTALLTLLFQLAKNNRTPKLGTRDLELLTLRTTERQLRQYRQYERFDRSRDADVRFIAYFLRRYTRDLDHRHYIVTYRELNAILARFRARLVNPTGNRIDVVLEVEDYRGVVAFRKTTFEKHVVQIGFHDWGSEVSPTDIRALRAALDLTEAHGVDSQVFFQGVDPVESLIREYAGPLHRLADK